MAEDMRTKEEFKYSSELEDIVRRWLEAMTEQSLPSGQTQFAEALKSGVVLCKLINRISPGAVPKINSGNIAYLQMENINHYLKACRTVIK